MFAAKNHSYGADDDVFYNFRETARRVMRGQFPSEAEDMFRVLAAYVDKHWVALCNRGLEDPDFEERCRDIAIYMLIAIALRRCCA